MRNQPPARQRGIKLEGEAALAAQVVEKLNYWGWEVFQEVLGGYGVIDIVARRGNLIWVIECKMSFGLSVIEQAFKNKGYAHLSSVAVPKVTSSFAKFVCNRFGVGIITTKRNDYKKTDELKQQLRPEFNRRILPIELHEEQKTWLAAGSKGGGHFTPFKSTCAKLVKIVEARPGIELKDAIKQIDHHYSSFASARSCLSAFIGNVIPELKFQTVGGKSCLFISDKGKP